MADTNTAILGLLLQDTGNNDNTWGALLNTQVIQLIEDAIAGRSAITVTSSDVTLSATQARSAILDCSGTLTGNRSLIVPNASKSWIVRNNTSGAFSLSVKTSGGSGVEVAQGGFCTVWCNGSNACFASVASNASGGGGGGGGSTSEMADGSAAAPGLYFTNDTNTGIYRVGGDTLAISAGGTAIFYVATTGVDVVGNIGLGGQMLAAGTVSAPAYSFTSDADTGMYRVGSNNIGISANGSKIVDIATSGVSITGTLSTSSNAAFTGTITGTSSSANALAVGRAGATTPALQVDASAASSATGLKITAAAASSGVALAAISSATNENLTVNAKGSGTITIGNLSTGAVVISRNTSITGTLSATGAATLSSTLAVTGAVTMSSTLSVTGALTAGSIVSPVVAVAWGTFSGGSLVDSHGFSGATNPATGTYSFSFSSSRPNSNYVAVATGEWSGEVVRLVRIASKTTAGFNVNTLGSTGANAAVDGVNVVVFDNS